ncbi:hypothetical protein HNR46_003720 [Haloferula luteola]|uniref:Uncharacterized protein n=1 Tax=Haloferula luteola TaxID=595692 RepID=A0A840VI48_9BACT|nr:hypothetical protein [Haloferula luteola]MBB5353459.1 hypothetical protein [Haloferula luteola]
MTKHRFLAIDEGLAQLLHVDEAHPENDWAVPVGHPQARDMQLVGGGRVLVGHHHGWSEFDIATGEVHFENTSYEGVTAARRQPDGRTLLAGVDIAGIQGVGVIELGTDGQPLRKIQYEGDYVRLIRQTAQGTLLMSCNDRIREADLDGNYLREFPVEGFYHAWKSLRLPDGHLMVSAGYGAFMVELDVDGNIVRKFGGKEQIPEEVNPFFYATFQLLPDGHLVLANWQGHGERFGESGVQLLEFDADGKLVWQWSDSRRISSLQGLLVLDGLDVSRLHDEREGVMKPL